MNEKAVIVDKEASLKKDVREKNGKPHVSEKKKEEVTKLIKLLKEFNTIALVDITSLPSAQLQIMRKKLEEGTFVRITKKRLIKKAIEQCKDKKGLDEFETHLENVMPALIFSKQNSFKLSSFLRKNKSNVAAKPGQIAPKDLMVNAGPTPFAPGPIIGELGAMGVKATVEEGKIVVKEDTVVVKEGEEINDKIADLLAKLDVKPMEIGLNLVAAYEDGLVLGKDVLDFDEDAYVDEIKSIASDAFKLTVGIGYVTKENIQLLLNKAESEVKVLVEKAGLITDDSVKKMLGKAELEAKNLSEKVTVEGPDEKKEEKKEEVKEPEKKEVKEKTEDLKKENLEKKEEKLLEKSSSKEPLLEKDVHEKKEEKAEVSEDKKMDTVIVDKSKEEVPTAEELMKRKKEKEEASEEEEKKEEVPSLHDLTEKKEVKKEDDVPKIDELVEKKKNTGNTEEK